MRLWNLRSLNRHASPERGLARFHFAVHATGDSIGYETMFGPEENQQNAIKRILGGYLVASMPAKGLEETLETLKSIYEFNVENLKYQLPQPTLTRTGTGTVRSVSEAPDLTIGE